MTPINQTVNAPTIDCATLTRAGVLSGTWTPSVERREKQRIARRPAEPLRRPGLVRVVVHEAQAGRDAARQCQVLVLVVRQRLVDPVEKAEGEPQGEPGGRGRDDEAAGARVVHGHRANPIAGSRSACAEICSETRPTRNTMTAIMMSRTDELVTWL